MRHLILKIVLCLFIFCSCSSDDYEEGIIGQWKLIQVLADPGDGSGDFIPVSSNKTVIFLSDSTFTTIGSLCNFDMNSDGESTGTFSIDKIFVNTCPNLAGTIRDYKMQDDILEVYYPCIEPCVEKYRKID